ncbi:MAG TPA: hypothetical protein VEI73_14320 [Candidatus Acidoferrum sp.]|nr:hypothetical protein [Candidatus Acidoferrum sp.]
MVWMNITPSIASVLVGPVGSTEDAGWSRGMAMSMKEKLLLVLLVMVVALSFFFSHYWACTLFVIQRAVATGLLPVRGFTMLAPWIAGVHFFP